MVFVGVCAVRKGLHFAPFIVVAGFIGVAVMRWPLPYVFIALAPVSIALAWFTAVKARP